MPPAARKGDKCTGHGCWPSRPNDQGSPDVFINNKPAHRKGDHWVTHCCKKCHDSQLAQGSPTVFTNGKQQGRKGDPVACGSKVAEGSPDVFVGGDGGGGSGNSSNDNNQNQNTGGQGQGQGQGENNSGEQQGGQGGNNGQGPTQDGTSGARGLDQSGSEARDGSNERNMIGKINGPSGQGSGVLVSKDGTMFSAAHVFGKNNVGDTVSVDIGGSTRTATVTGIDRYNDFATLRLNDTNGLTPARISSSGINVGDRLTGYGFGAGQDLSSRSFTASGTQRIQGYPDFGLYGGGMEWNVSGGSLRSGQSGGPVFNSRGELVGLNQYSNNPSGVGSAGGGIVSIPPQYRNWSTATDSGWYGRRTG